MVSDQSPRRLGKYQILEEIGRGSFGVVYRAVDATLNRTVALKILAPHLVWHPEFVERFQREAQTAANLRHPNIVLIYEVGEEQGRHFIAMEYLPGRPLDRIIAEEGALPLERVVVIIEQIASALDAAHGQGLIHRDVKSSNIIVSQGGHATLTDFGLVRAAEMSGLSSQGQMIGTPEYMSPEQAQAEDVDWRSDLYSLGVVVYEMCVGRVPFRADTPFAVLRGHVDRHPPEPRNWAPHLPQAVQDVLLKALAKDRQTRYQSASAIPAALRDCLASQAEARYEGERRKGTGAEAITGRLPLWALIGGVAVVAMILGGVLFWVIAGRGSPASVVVDGAGTATRAGITPMPLDMKAVAAPTAMQLVPTPAPTATLGPTETSTPTWTSNPTDTSVPTITPEPSTSTPEGASHPITHVVQQGETLPRIAEQYGIPWLDVARANDIGSPYWVVVGQRLVIPRTATPAALSPEESTVTPSGERTHIVQQGENLFRIALKYGMSWEAIAQANAISNPADIYVGQKLVIP